MLKFRLRYKHLNESSIENLTNDEKNAHRIIKPTDALKGSSFISKKYETYIFQITRLLNDCHDRNYSQRYWEILLGFWLLKSISIVYDKYSILKDYPEMEINSIKYPKGIRPLCKLVNPSEIQHRKDWNEYILFKVRQIVNNEEESDLNNLIKSKLTLIGWISADKFKNISRKILKKQKTISNNKVKTTYKTAITENIKHLLYSEKSHDLILKIRADEELFLYKEINFYSLKLPNKKFRGQLFSKMIIQDDFDRCFWAFANDIFPTFYLEEYEKAAKKSVQKYKWHKVENIFTSHDITLGLLSNFSIAQQMETHNSKIIGIQHGGGYGLVSSLQINLEIKLTNYFVTWGWTSRDETKFIKMPCLKMDNIYTENKKLEKKGILYVTTTTQPFYNYVGLGTNLLNSELYNSNIGKIINALLISENISIEWRPYTARLRTGGEYLNYVVKSIIPDYADRLFIETSGSFYKRINRCELFLSDHLGTTMLEALNANIPTIIILEKEWDIVSDEIEKSLAGLVSVNIVFYSIDEAAEYINKIWEGVDSWWNNRKRQCVKNEFVKTFANRDFAMVDAYYELFKGTEKLE